jgi:hypothetical protein
MLMAERASHAAHATHHALQRAHIRHAILAAHLLHHLLKTANNASHDK